MSVRAVRFHQVANDSEGPADQFIALVGPIIESAMKARAELADLDRSVTNGVLTTDERHARSALLIRKLHDIEADLAFWLPPDGINSLREAISATRPERDFTDKAGEILAQVWVTMDVVIARDARREHWKTEQARKYPSS